MYSRIFISLGVIASLLLLLLVVLMIQWNLSSIEGIRIQQKYDEYISEREIDGRANVLFYFEEVRLHGDGFNKNEIMRAKYIIHGSDIIKILDISDTQVSSDDIADLKHEYAPILISHDEYD